MPSVENWRPHDGFGALVPIPNEKGRHRAAPIRSWPLGRRSGCFSTTPTILPRPPGGGQFKRAAVHPIDHTHLFITDLHALHQSGYQLPLQRPVSVAKVALNGLSEVFQVAD